MEKVKFYDKFMSDLWQRDLKFVNYRVEAIKKLINRFVPKNSRILEIGCGNGLVTRHLAKKAKSVLAIDLSWNATENAKKYTGRDNCTFVTADIAYTDIQASELYNVIVMADVIEHIEKHSQRWVMNMLNRLLTSNGMVILTWPHSDAQTTNKQIVEETVDIREILALTDLKLFYFAYVDVDGRNKYVHCVLKKRISFIAEERSFTFRLLNVVKKTLLRIRNAKLIYETSRPVSQK